MQIMPFFASVDHFQREIWSAIRVKILISAEETLIKMDQISKAQRNSFEILLSVTECKINGETSVTGITQTFV